MGSEGDTCSEFWPFPSNLSCMCTAESRHRGAFGPALFRVCLSLTLMTNLPWALSLVFPGPPTEFPSPQYVVIPTRRSTAEAFQIVLSHLLGDAGSPYLIGLVSTVLDRDGMLLGSGTPYPCRWLVTGA